VSKKCFITSMLWSITSFCSLRSGIRKWVRLKIGPKVRCSPDVCSICQQRARFYEDNLQATRLDEFRHLVRKFFVRKLFKFRQNMYVHMYWTNLFSQNHPVALIPEAIFYSFSSPPGVKFGPQDIS
jgi:hypothetical protein